MTAIILTTLILGLIVYGLQRNHDHQSQPHARFAGSTGVDNRDAVRVYSEIGAIPDPGWLARPSRLSPPVAGHRPRPTHFSH